jgi:hypothetical protein
MASPRALGPLNSAQYFSRLSRLRRRSYKCFYPFHVAFAVFGDASSVTRFASAVCPLRISMGESTFLWVASDALARPDALTPFNDPDAQATRWFCASCEALERELKLRSWISLFASKGDLRRFIQGSVLSHISCFSHNPRKIITEFAFCALQLEGFKGGRHVGGLPQISPWASICGEVLLF